jgi:hypothetical protein
MVSRGNRDPTPRTPISNTLDVFALLTVTVNKKWRSEGLYSLLCSEGIWVLGLVSV